MMLKKTHTQSIETIKNNIINWVGNNQGIITLVWSSFFIPVYIFAFIKGYSDGIEPVFEKFSYPFVGLIVIAFILIGINAIYKNRSDKQFRKNVAIKDSVKVSFDSKKPKIFKIMDIDNESDEVTILTKVKKSQIYPLSHVLHKIA